MPELFTVTGVGTRKVERALAAGVPAALVAQDLETLISEPCDVVVELIGGTTRAASLVEESLRLGRHVVTANKALLAESGDSLVALGRETGASLSFSAAVGGVVPALEAIERARVSGPIRSFRGVLNGTCNFVLDQLATGANFETAVRLAQEKGYAEEDPKLDLEGIDAAQKLILLARRAFNVSLPLASVQVEGICAVNAELVSEVRKRDRTLRLVAECALANGQVVARVAPVELPLSDSLAQVGGVENRLIVELEAGEPIVVSGTGAGRWPTTEAVLADLFEIRLNQQGNRNISEELEECVA